MRMLMDPPYGMPTRGTPTPVPVWPLPADWKHAAGDTPPPPTPNKPNPNVQCRHCLEWLCIMPNTRDMKKHLNSLKCKKGRESIQMNREGYHTLSTYTNQNLVGFNVESIKRFARQGKKFGNHHQWYYPAPLVSFIRWMNDVKRKSKNKDFQEDLVAFLQLDEEHQIAQLAGHILQHELKD